MKTFNIVDDNRFIYINGKEYVRPFHQFRLHKLPFITNIFQLQMSNTYIRYNR